MANKEKRLELSLGIDTEGYGERISYLKNLVRKNGALVKRQGHRAIYRFESEELLPLRINGIFTYGGYLIVHAGSSLFRCLSDFSEVVPVLTGDPLPDKRSSAFSLDGLLIIECQGAYVYDGTTVMSIDKRQDLYIPKTTVGIRNINSGVLASSYERKNILTPKRINTLLGESSTEKVSAFILDSEVVEGSEVNVKVQVRLKSTPSEIEGEELECTSYVGIDAEGNEVLGIANVIFNVSSYRDGATYRVSEPITDENGNEISIRTSDGEVYSYKTILWFLQISGKVLRLNMELIPPYPNEDNIEVTFSSKEAVSLTEIENMGIISCKGGENVLALCFGNGEIYYTSKDMGTRYLPDVNKIKVGTASTKIQRLISLQNGYIGAFTNEGFYKIAMVEGAGEEGTYKTGDCLSLASPYGVGCVGNEPLALAGDGVYGVKSLSGYQDKSIYLEKRSSKIDTLISSFTRDERENAHMTALGNTLYLFIGDKALVTGRELRSKESAYATEQYEWYLLDNMKIRCSTAVDTTLYMGREDGTILTFYEGYSDVDERELSYDGLEIWTREYLGNTAFVTPYLSQIKNGDLLSGSFPVKIGEVACSDGRISLSYNDLFYSNGEIRLFENESICLYRDKEKIYEGKIASIDKCTCELTFDISCEDGTYELYIINENAEYEIELLKDAFFARDKDRYIFVPSVDNVKITRKQPICASLTVSQVQLGDSKKLKMADHVLIKPIKSTQGNIKISIESQRGASKRELRLAQELSLDRLSLESFSLEKQFDKSYTLPFMIFTEDFVNIEIEADSCLPFGIEWVNVGWKGEK